MCKCNYGQYLRVANACNCLARRGSVVLAVSLSKDYSVASGSSRRVPYSVRSFQYLNLSTMNLILATEKEAQKPRRKNIMLKVKDD
jgi:hypothetical protein